jgi:hypothetical protein
MDAIDAKLALDEARRRRMAAGYRVILVQDSHDDWLIGFTVRPDRRTRTVLTHHKAEAPIRSARAAYIACRIAHRLGWRAYMIPAGS